MSDMGGGVRICGKRGGEPFKTAVRPASTNSTKCSKAGYFPCNEQGSPEKTTCVKTKDQCPITFLRWINSTQELP